MVEGRAGVSKAWAVVEGDKRVQRLIEWRIHNQKMEERVLLESIRNEERLEIAGRLQDALGNKLNKCDKDNMMEIDILFRKL